MSRMPSGTQDSLPGGPRIPNQCHPTKIFGITYRNYRRTSRSYKRTDNGTLQCLLRKGLLQFLPALRQKDMRRMQKLQDTLSLVEKNVQNIQTNCLSVGEEIEEIYRRLNKALKDRTEYLRTEIDKYLTTELKSLTSLKENLELEISNIMSNCDLADKHMNESVDIWDDCELMDAKEIFLKTVEFIRNFEYENSDYSRKVRLVLAHDPNQLVLHVAGFGDLNISASHFGATGLLQPPGLMRSKSDHRLASQFRQQEERGYDDDQVLGGRKFGERPKTSENRYDSRYGEDYDHESSRPGRSKYSRFRRHQHDNDSDGEQPGAKGVRFTTDHHHKHEREKAFDTEDASRGPLSGITRLADSPRVMKKMQDHDSGKLKKKEEPPAAPQPKVVPKRPPPPTTQRQVSEEDEISRIKKQNKGATTSATETAAETRPSEERQRKPHGPSESTTSTESSSASSSVIRSTGAPFTTEEVKQKILSKNKAPAVPAAASKQPSTKGRYVANKEETETSSEEETESEEESEEETTKETKEMAKTDIGPLLARSANARGDNSATSKYGSAKDEPASKYSKPRMEDDHSRYGYTSRFLNKSKSSAAIPPEDEDLHTSRYSAADEDKYPSNRSRYMALKDRRQRLARSRSSQQFGDDDEPDEPVSPTTSNPSAYLASRGYGTSSAHDLSRSRSSHALKSRDNSPERPSATAAAEKDGAALSSWARYLKNKYGNRGGGSKDKDATGGSGGSSAGAASSSSSAAARRLSLGLPLRSSTDLASSDDDSKNMRGSPTTHTAATAVAGIAQAVAGTCLRGQYLEKGAQLFQIGSRGSEAGCFTWPRGIAVFDSNGRFVKEFGQYGNKEGEFDCLAGVAVNRIGQYIIADRYNHRIQVFDPSGRFLRTFGSQGTADGRFNYPWGITTDALGFIYVCDKENHRVQSDGTFVGKFGTVGSGEGQLEHPHYIAVSSTNRVVVSDSNNHRIQIFDVNGKVITTFGTEGADEGQFKFPRGVAVDDQGTRTFGRIKKIYDNL
nr:unnamed protein product [Callosobruchus analis]